MKKIYETIIIFTDELSRKAYNDGVDHYAKIIEELVKGDVYIDRIGKKKLAYEVKERKEGWYVTFTYKSNPDKIPALERLLRIDDNVLKYLTTSSTTIEDDEDDEDIVHEFDDAGDLVDNLDDDLDLDSSQAIKSEQKKKPIVDVFDLIFGIKD